MTERHDQRADWINDLPEMLKAAADDLRLLAESSAAPMRDKLDLASIADLDQLRSLLVRIESRVSELEARLDRLESSQDSQAPQQ